MRFHEITNDPRPRHLPPRHPHLAVIYISSSIWRQFEALIESTRSTRMAGYTPQDHGFLTAYIACSSAAERHRLEHRWD
jgi:hypothetical protein